MNTASCQTNRTSLLYSLCSQALPEVLLSFGQHKSKAIKQVDDEYLRWMRATLRSSWWRRAACQVLEQRKQEQASRKSVVLSKLKVCSTTGNLDMGKEIHAEAMETGTASCIYIATALVKMYARCGRMAEARQAFEGIKRPDVVAWTALVLGYAENGEGATALELFGRMRAQGVAPDLFTFVAALKACTCLALKQLDPSGRAECLARGKEIHAEIGPHSDTYVHSTLIDMYAKCGSMNGARDVFDAMKQRGVVSWTSLILGYAENGDAATALQLFSRMKSQGLSPDSFSFVAALKACSVLGALETGRRIHADISCEQVNTILVNSLVDFYSKCGCLVEAQLVFDSQPRRRSLVTWTALLAGYCRLGDSKAAFGLFERMQDAGFKPDGVTFVCILTCCSHAGLLGKAAQLFEAMPREYGITPTLEHYTCMVDILGRSNKVDDAIGLLRTMPCAPDVVTWMTILAACRKWKNIEIGRLAFKSLMALDHTNAAAYVLMAHIYGSCSMWQEQQTMLVMGNKFQACSESGQSCWTDEGGEVHTFLVRDTKHPQITHIREKLKAMLVMMRRHGYVVN